MSFRILVLRSLYFLAVGLVLAALWLFRDLWLLVFFAAVVAVGISIPAHHLQRIGLPRPLAVAIAVLGMLLIAFELGFWLVPVVANDLEELLDRLPEFVSLSTQLYTDWRAQSEWRSVLLPPVPVPVGDNGLSVERLQEVIGNSTRSSLPILVTGGGFLASLFANLFFVTMLAIFFLAEPKAYVRVSLYLLPRRRHTQLLALWSALYDVLRTWLSTLFLSILLTVALVWLVLGALGLSNVLVVAVFAGLATFVPNIGVFLPLIPITVFSLVTSPDQLLLMVLAYLAIQFVESNVLTPAIVRRQLNIPPAATLTFQVLMSIIFGVIGIFLAVPLLAVLIVLVRELYSYGLLGFRQQNLKVILPQPISYAPDTWVQRWWRARRQKKRVRKKGNAKKNYQDSQIK